MKSCANCSHEPSDREPFGLAASLFVVCMAIFAYPWLSGRVTIPWDAKAHFYPQFVFLAHALHNGQSPFWTPHVFAGMPQIADPQSLIFSPFFLIAATMFPDPSFILSDAISFAMLTMGGLALIACFHDRGWSAGGAMIAALAFTMGGSAAWRLQHTGQIMSLSWLPVTLWLLARALDRRSIVYGAAAGAVAAMLVLGRDQVAFLGVILLASFAIYRVLTDDLPWISALNPLLAGAITGGALVALPLAFTLALAQNSNRPAIDLVGAHKGSLPPGSFLTLISANLFGTDGPLKDFWGPPSATFGTSDIFLARNMTDIYAGELTLAATLVALGAGIYADRQIRFFIGSAVFFALYALGRYTPAFDVFYHIPGVDLWRRPADATFLFGFVFAILGGYGFSLIERGAIKVNVFPLTGALFGLICLALGVAALKGHLAQALTPVGISLGFAALAVAVIWGTCAGILSGKRLIGVVALVLAADLIVNNGPNESTALPPEQFEVLRPDSKDPVIAFLRDRLKQNAAPARRDRVELAAIDFHWPNATLVHGLDHDLGYNPLRLKVLEDATGAGDHLALPEQREFSKLYPSYRSSLSDMLGLRYIATGSPIEQIDKAYKAGDFEELAQIGDVRIYENKNAFPRAQVVTCAMHVDFAQMIATGEWPEADLHETVLLEEPPLCRTHKNLPPEAIQARILSYNNDDIRVETVAPTGGGWLVLYDVWHPWWFASLDGAETPILRANTMFRAIVIPEGRHEARFRFQPLRGLFVRASTPAG